MTERPLPDGRVPVVLSAHTPHLLAAEAINIADHIERHGITDVAAVATTAARLRRRRRHRAVIRAHDSSELCAGLRALAAGDDHWLVATSSRTAAAPAVFVFPGNGNQWPAMGIEAYRELPVYREAVDRCAAEFVAAGVVSPLEFLTDAGADRQWQQIHSQGAQFTHAVGLAALWSSCGIEPAATLGHSLGEIAAGHLAGAMSLTDAVAVVIARARALDGLTGDYRAAGLGLTADEARQLISELPGWMELSVVNAAASVVVSGDAVAIDGLVARVQGDGRFARVIAMTFPAHTSVLEPLRDQMARALAAGRFRPAGIPFVGSVTATAVGADTAFGDYWFRNLRETVRFDRAAAAVANRYPGGPIFVEISAHPALLHALDDLDALILVGSGHRDETLPEALSRNIAAVAIADPDHPWTTRYRPAAAVLRGFPNAPMSATTLWARPEPLPVLAGPTVAGEHWVAQPETEPPLIIRRFAVLELPGPAGQLATTLRASVRADLGAVPVDPAEADTLIVVAPALDHPDVGAAVADLAALIDTGLCDYTGAIGADCRNVWLITVGGEHVRAGEPVALPAQAALGALHRSFGFAHPDQSFSHLDLPSWEADRDTADAAIKAILTTEGEVALRYSDDGDPTCFLRTLPDVAEAPPWDLRGGLLDEVVITGGNGAVGLHFARFLVGAGARHIVLLSRRGADPQVLAELGGAVESVRCDITSAAQVAAAAAEHAGNGATLVIHTAGSAAFGSTITGRDLTDTAHAKLSGLSRITEHWPMGPNTRIVVCSSVSGLWGGQGHAAYAAVNRMADVLAGQYRAGGRACTAVRWGLWPGAGIAGPDEVTQIRRAGLLEMDADLAVESALRDHTGDPLVFSADPARLGVFLGQDGGNAEQPAQQSVSDLAGADPETVLRIELAATLKAGDPAELDLTTSLVDLGVDSLLALDLRKRLRRGTGTAVPMASLLSGITGLELVALLRARPAGAQVIEEKVET